MARNRPVNLAQGAVNMEFTTIDIWERLFRAEAENDNYAFFREHLNKLDLPDKPELLIDGTILVMRACEVYWRLDQRELSEFGRFLDIQRYKPLDTTETRLAYTFNIHDFAFARAITEPGFHALDLADLYNHPWDAYEISGYYSIQISRIDWKVLSDEERQQIEDSVTKDFRFTYSEDELEIRVFPEENSPYLTVQPAEQYDDDDEECESE